MKPLFVSEITDLVKSVLVYTFF